MAKARKISRDDIIAHNIERGKFPPLEDVLRAFRHRHLEDGHIPTDEDGNFEAPEDYPWAALRGFVEQQTKQSVEVLMNETLAGFPLPFDIEIGRRGYAEKFKARPDKHSGKEKAPGNFDWAVLNAVARSIEKGWTATKISKQVDVESEQILDVPTPSSIASFSTPMHEVKMAADVRTAIKAYQAEAEENFKRETARNAVSAPKAHGRKSQMPDRHTGLTDDDLDIDGHALCTLEECAEAIRNCVREHKTLPSGHKKNPMVLPSGRETTSAEIDKALQDELVYGGRDVMSLAKLVKAMGFLQPGHYAQGLLPNKPLEIRQVFIDLLDYVTTLHELPDHTRLGSRGHIGLLSVKAVMFAFQSGHISGWEEFAASRNIPANIKPPVNLNDFMVLTGFAKRLPDYGVALSIEDTSPVYGMLKQSPKLNPPPEKPKVHRPAHRDLPDPDETPLTLPAGLKGGIMDAIRSLSSQRAATTEATSRPAFQSPAQVPAGQEGPKRFKPSLRPGRIDRFTLLEAADALRTHMREHATLKNLQAPDNVKLNFPRTPGLSAESVNSAFARKRVTDAKDVTSLSDFKERVGFIAETRFPPDILQGKTFNARDIFNDVAGYVRTHGMLPTHDRTGKKEMVGEHRVKVLTLAFQQGVVNGWSELAGEIGASPDLPVCFYDFLEATGFAYRDPGYRVQLVDRPPKKLEDIPKTQAQVPSTAPEKPADPGV